jgi:hypothetical protein
LELGYHDTTEYKESVEKFITSILLSGEYDLLFLQKVMASSFNSLIIDRYRDQLINHHDFKYIIDNLENKMVFYDISNLLIGDILNTNQIVEQFEKFTFGAIDKTFIESMGPCVYIAGGALISAMKGQFYPWSDLDFWVWSNKCMDVHNVIKFLEKLERRFKKYGNLTWSMRKNVISLYCDNYRRNIQVILSDRAPDENINYFDMDYVQAYYYQGAVYANARCIASNLSNTIHYYDDTTTDSRIIKTLMKGYRFAKLTLDSWNATDGSHSIHKNIKNIIKLYQNNECKDLQALIAKKYYYPVSNESFERKKYLINLKFCHKDVFPDLAGLIKFLLTSEINTIQYTPVYDYDVHTIDDSLECNFNTNKNTICKIIDMKDIDIEKITFNNNINSRY